MTVVIADKSLKNKEIEQRRHYSKFTVLVIDDDKSYRRLFRKIIEERVGAQCIEAENPIAAFEHFKVLIPDLIIVDMLMPVLNGMAAIERLKKIPASSSIPVIACTGVTDRDVIVKLAKLGVSEFILKPLNGVTAVDKIIRALPAEPPRETQH